jgi:S-layer homology domain
MRLPWQGELHVDDREAMTGPGQHRRIPRRLAVIGVAALMLAVPVAVQANHLFSDVPTSNTFHAVISTLYGSRITGGCGSGKYCPNAAVTRGQMAAFMVRGLGRMASTTDGSPDDWTEVTQPPANPGDPHPFGTAAPLSFVHGGGAGGTAFVFATGTVQVFTNEPGVCPCEVQAFLFTNTTGEFSQFFFGMIGSDVAPADPDLISPTQYAETTMTLSYAFSVDSGVSNDYGIALKVIPTTAPTVDANDDLVSGWDATLQTVYVPFNEVGGNPPGPPATAGGQRTPKNPHILPHK